MRPILGGNVPPDQVIGRDVLIHKMWRLLDDQSLVLVAERRIGKTSVIRKMALEPAPGWFPVYQVIEGLRSPTEFIDRIVDALGPKLSHHGNLWVRTQQLWQHLGGQRLGQWDLPQLQDNWKRILRSTLEDIQEALEERVIFFWDELPLMVSNRSTQ